MKAKEDYRASGVGDVKTKVVTGITEKLADLTQKLNLKNFTFPIHPSYTTLGFSMKKCTIFGSKMVPILIASRSSESKNVNDEKNIFRVIYKCGKIKV